MSKSNVNGLSVAAMMRRGLSLAESHLILASPPNGTGSRWSESPARR
ncbi:MAG TPA: hypothetical protein VE053_10125 [Allosphingosinicella sp.]|nr:hypothetical protein [Allosphingosinicella sp.]